MDTIEPTATTGELTTEAVIAEITRLRTSNDPDAAIKIGELLTHERHRHGHGKWMRWIEENLPFNARVAGICIREYQEARANRVRVSAAPIAAPQKPRQYPPDWDAALKITTVVQMYVRELAHIPQRDLAIHAQAFARRMKIIYG